MRRLLLLLALLPLAAHAHDAPRRIAEQEVLRGQFNEVRVLRDFAAPLKSSGTFVIAPPHGLLWITQKPFATTTVISPSGIVQLVDGQETTRLTAGRMPFMMRIYTMLNGTLAGDWALLEQDFVVKRHGTNTRWQVDLTPRATDDSTMPFTMIHVQGGRFVDKVVMQKREGESDTIIFAGQKLSGSPLLPQERAHFVDEAK